MLLQIEKNNLLQISFGGINITKTEDSSIK